MMYKDVSQIELLEKGRGGWFWRHDRKDIYRYSHEERSFHTMDIRLFYKIEQVNCNPDFDW